MLDTIPFKKRLIHGWNCLIHRIKHGGNRVIQPLGNASVCTYLKPSHPTIGFFTVASLRFIWWIQSKHYWNHPIQPSVYSWLTLLHPTIGLYMVKNHPIRPSVYKLLKPSHPTIGLYTVKPVTSIHRIIHWRNHPVRRSDYSLLKPSDPTIPSDHRIIHCWNHPLQTSVYSRLKTFHPTIKL